MKTFYIAVIDDEWYITTQPVRPKSRWGLGYDPDAPAPLLPPDEYQVIMVPPMRAATHGGGITTRKQKKHNRRKTMKKRAHHINV